MPTRGVGYVFSLVLVAAVVAVTVAGCGGGGGGGGNSNPVINSLTAAAQAIWQSGSTQITVAARDPDGDPLTYTWSANGGTINGAGTSVLFTAPSSGGRYTITVTVRDSGGGQATRTITITVGATVRGTVNDVLDGQPEAGVQVIVNGLSGTTDNTGAFEIVGIGQGTHVLTLGGDWVVAGADVNVTANTPGQVITLNDPVQGVNVGGGPPPPPF